MINFQEVPGKAPIFTSAVFRVGSHIGDENHVGPLTLTVGLSLPLLFGLCRQRVPCEDPVTFLPACFSPLPVRSAGPASPKSVLLAHDSLKPRLGNQARSQKASSDWPPGPGAGGGLWDLSPEHQRKPGVRGVSFPSAPKNC